MPIFKNDKYLYLLHQLFHMYRIDTIANWQFSMLFLFVLLLLDIKIVLIHRVHIYVYDSSLKKIYEYTLYMKTAEKIHIQHTLKTVKKISYTIYIKNRQISRNHIQIYENLSTIWYYFWSFTKI